MNKGLYRARLWTAEGEVYLGHFDAPEKAGQAYDRASMRTAVLTRRPASGLTTI